MSKPQRRYFSWKFPVFAIVVGICLTFITGLTENPPLVATIDTTNYGYPFVWYIVKGFSPASPVEIRYIFLIIDMVFWSAVAFLLLVLTDVFTSRPIE